jgi:hypothetical protein
MMKQMDRRAQSTLFLVVWVATAFAPSAFANDTDFKTVVRDVADHEIQLQTNSGNSGLLWSYRKVSRKGGVEQVWQTCQTRHGNLHRLIAENGARLSPSREREEAQRIQRLVDSPSELRAAQKKDAADMKEEQKFLRLLSRAFVFREQERQGDVLTLAFTPDPNFQPSGNEQVVLHTLTGTLTLDAANKRLVAIRGHLLHEVRFWGGLAGHLDAGGNFSVETIRTAPGDREIKTLDIEMHGKALLFKTISVQEHDEYSDYAQVPPSTTLAEAAARLNQEAKN